MTMFCFFSYDFWKDNSFSVGVARGWVLINNCQMAEMVGPRLYSCCNCRNQVALHDDVISKSFQVENSILMLLHLCLSVGFIVADSINSLKDDLFQRLWGKWKGKLEICLWKTFTVYLLHECIFCLFRVRTIICLRAHSCAWSCIRLTKSNFISVSTFLIQKICYAENIP